MGVLSAANMITLCDKLTAEWLAAKAGLNTAYSKAQDNETTIAGLDADVRAALTAGFTSHRVAIDPFAALFRTMAAPLTLLKAEAARTGLSGVNSINSFLTYYNIGAGKPWNCLMAPDFRDLHYAATKAYPSPYNVYFEVLQGGTYTNALRKSVVTGAGADTETAGFSIDDTKYAGGVAKLNVSGLTGTGTITFAGLWRKEDGTTATGNGSQSVTGNGLVTVGTLPFTNALLLTCTSVTIPAGISAGTVYVEAHRPTGRTNPPS